MGRKSIVKTYGNATMEKRVEIILDNYSNFDCILRDSKVLSSIVKLAYARVAKLVDAPDLGLKASGGRLF